MRYNEEDQKHLQAVPEYFEKQGRNRTVHHSNSNTSSNQLLGTKFSLPPIRSELVQRARLLLRLDEGRSSRLMLISAPAGSGKTTLLGFWLAQQPASCRAWLTLDASDNDPIRFWRYILAAFAHIRLDLPADLEPFLPLDIPPVALEMMVTSLINALSSDTREILLVLDDYHMIDNPLIHKSLSFFIDNLPGHIHLYLTGRSVPPFALARLRVRNQLQELQGEDLRFTLEEARTFLQQMPGLALAEPEIALLEERTEGWIAGLQLAAISLRNRLDQHELLATFSGTHHHVTEYLLTEVFQQQSAGLQNFLLLTSVLQRLESSLCEAVTGMRESEQMLISLEQLNFFLVPLDQQRRWYRYHQLFADFLRQRLAQTQPDLPSILLSRASQWCTGQGLTLEAIEYALSACAFPAALDLIEILADDLFKRRELTTFLRWMNAVPVSSLQAHPQLIIGQGWLFLSLGQAEAAEKYITMLSHTPSSPEVNAELAALRATLAAMRGDPAQIQEQIQQLDAHLMHIPSWLHGIAALNQGTVHALSGDISAAIEQFSAAAEIGLQQGNSYGALVATCQLGAVELMQGKLQQSAETYSRAIQLARNDRNLLDASLAHIGKSGILLEWNRLAEAAAELQTGIAQSQRSGNQATLTFSYLNMAQLYQAQGRVAESQQALKEVERLLQDQQLFPFLLISIADTAIRLCLLQENQSAIRGWARYCEMEPQAPLDPFSLFSYLAAARLHLVASDPQRALLLLLSLRQFAETNAWHGPLINTLLLEAVAYQMLARYSQALAALARALELAEPERYQRVFLDAAPRINELLLRVLRAQQRGKLKAWTFSTDYVKSLLSQCPPAAEPVPAAFPLQTLPYPLSERELEILRLIAQGLTNQAITQQLMIEQSTLKTHIRHIYHKLSTERRTQAVVRARELGLL